ncbi:hypothetical protein ACVBEG_27040 [Pseudomonas sp. GG8]
MPSIDPVFGFGGRFDAGLPDRGPVSRTNGIINQFVLMMSWSDTSRLLVDNQLILQDTAGRRRLSRLAFLCNFVGVGRLTSSS